ncbi:PREDICTED: pentatricopeptide repeat-containing protein At4g04790, mitochondrial-like [Nelumbo nucifera]|uniref:Pentatricopeptide repeat-containing protein At4g04790, mitochondrial-like n=2 Tax=Nelumbo nucifera TaxID=4432 RepID=A0A1U7Z2U3_NELNU|nr:PREDICTED: pentatricopeptide repeat-containing protein At4g04790, mitochondrial-like [Nelumbo nucifera]DAD20597.1 TPA_asm: hypothetical protein HUJ06_022060 [Nelumbo nucifera]
MPRSKVTNLSSLFGSAIKTTSEKSSRKVAQDIKKLVVSSLDSTSPCTSNSADADKPSKSSLKVLSKTAAKSKKFVSITQSKLAVEPVSSETQTISSSGDSVKQLMRDVTSLICGNTVLESQKSSDLQLPNDERTIEKVLNIPWFTNMSPTSILQRRKDISRERKQKWIFKNTQTHRFQKLVKMCAQKLGTEATLEVFGKLGRETGVKEYNALIGLCIEKARNSKDEEVSIDQIHKTFQLFKSMREQGFHIEEQTYGPLLMYLIDMEMIQEFQFFSEIVKEEGPTSFPRLGYYEMLLWIKVDNKQKIQELCDAVGDRYSFAESYLLALGENDRKKELLQLLEVVDITKISSLNCVASVFKSLGRLLLHNHMEKLILAFKNSEVGAENVSLFICYYATSIPNLVVEDIALKFRDLHEMLEVTPSSTSYEKLIMYCCDSCKVHEALSLVEQMFQSGLTLSVDTFNSILRASGESYEFDLVHQMYSAMQRHNLKPNAETFRSMINLCVRMKDFEGAYQMLKDLEGMNIMPTTNMYNAIMAGYFREKNVHGGLMVLKQMERADVKPDSHTFSYLIGNSGCEEDIIKYYEEMQRDGVQVTKHIYMALINAYANCGQFDKAKQVVLDQGLPAKSINEIKSALVSALSCHGQMTDALTLYEEIKKAGCHAEPKAIISLIEHTRSEGELNRLLQLLGELTDPGYWFDGCSRIILYCIRHNHLSSTFDLLKQLKDKHGSAMDAVLEQVFCQVSEMEPTYLQVGLDMLKVIKELDLHPSRTSLDFLLSSCLNAKDPRSAQLIFDEYKKVGLPYNVLTFLRMYQVLLASGENKSAKIMLKKIPPDDPHVRCIIKACQATYKKTISVNKNKKKRDSSPSSKPIRP